MTIFFIIVYQLDTKMQFDDQFNVMDTVQYERNKFYLYPSNINHIHTFYNTIIMDGHHPRMPFSLYHQPKYVFYFPQHQQQRWKRQLKRQNQSQIFNQIYIKKEDYLSNKRDKINTVSNLSKITIHATAPLVDMTPIHIQDKSPLYTNSNNQRSIQFFSGDVLEDEQDYKDYLTSTIQEYSKSKIKKTRVLFRYDFNNKTNIHKYVDNKPNIIFLAKTKQGFHLACYFQGILNPNVGVNSSGMIISMTNRKSYYCSNRQKAVNYDQFYLIFGNSEIRVKADECKLYSNFGTNNVAYNAEGDRVGDLLGEGRSKQVQLQCFEVHQIVFSS